MLIARSCTSKSLHILHVPDTHWRVQLSPRSLFPTAGCRGGTSYEPPCLRRTGSGFFCAIAIRYGFTYRHGTHDRAGHGRNAAEAARGAWLRSATCREPVRILMPSSWRERERASGIAGSPCHLVSLASLLREANSARRAFRETHVTKVFGTFSNF